MDFEEAPALAVFNEQEAWYSSEASRLGSMGMALQQTPPDFEAERRAELEKEKDDAFDALTKIGNEINELEDHLNYDNDNYMNDAALS